MPNVVFVVPGDGPALLGIHDIKLLNKQKIMLLGIHDIKLLNKQKIMCEVV